MVLSHDGLSHEAAFTEFWSSVNPHHSENESSLLKSHNVKINVQVYFKIDHTL